MNVKFVKPCGSTVTLIMHENCVAVLVFDCKDGSANTLSAEVLSQLEEAVSLLESTNDCRGVVFHSGKDHFILGANIYEIDKAQNLSREQTFAACFGASQRGKAVLNRIAALPFPKVAAINGVCLGGGTELSLVCDERIASPEAIIGLPEVLLGLLPGWGGSCRLPKMIGYLAAILMILLPLKPWNARKAQRFGLIDKIYERHYLLQEAIARVFALRMAAPVYPRLSPRRTTQSLLARIMRRLFDGNPGRALLTGLLSLLLKCTMDRKYPAFRQVLLLMNSAAETSVINIPANMDPYFHKESLVFAQLSLTEASRKNVDTFVQRQAKKRAKKAAATEPEAKLAVGSEAA